MNKILSVNASRPPRIKRRQIIKKGRAPIFRQKLLKAKRINVALINAQYTDTYTPTYSPTQGRDSSTNIFEKGMYLVKKIFRNILGLIRRNSSESSYYTGHTFHDFKFTRSKYRKNWSSLKDSGFVKWMDKSENNKFYKGEKK